MLMNGLTITNAGFDYVEPNTAWKIVADADFDGDGVTDLLWRNDSTGQVYLMALGSNGLPAGGAFIYTEPNPAWEIVATPDLDGDGHADIVWWNSSTGQVYALLMNGFAITAQGFVYTEPNTDWMIVAAGDFSGSGKQNQLLWRNDSNGQLYVVTATFNGNTFSTSGQGIITLSTAYKVVGAADFNGDGKSDILLRNDTTGQVLLLLMSGGTSSPFVTFQGVIYTEANQAWKIVGVGDYNGDGRADMLWRNDTTGVVWVAFLVGQTIIGNGIVYNEPNTAWKILGPWEYATQ
jgi:hypothetical protein